MRARIHLPVDWCAPGDSLEAACSRILERVSMKFRRRWLVDHCCSKCMGKEIIIDGNAKVPTRLCANTDAGVWNCKPLKCHCLTGCTHPPLPGFRFCALHQGDAESPTSSVMPCQIVIVSAVEPICSTPTNLSRMCTSFSRSCLHIWPEISM